MSATDSANDTVFEVGDEAILQGTFSIGGVVFDPISVTVLVWSPVYQGIDVSYTWPAASQVVHQATGVFQLPYSVLVPGYFEYQYTGITAQGYSRTLTGRFYCRPTAFTL